MSKMLEQAKPGQKHLGSGHGFGVRNNTNRRGDMAPRLTCAFFYVAQIQKVRTHVVCVALVTASPVKLPNPRHSMYGMYAYIDPQK